MPTLSSSNHRYSLLPKHDPHISLQQIHHLPPYPAKLQHDNFGHKLVKSASSGTLDIGSVEGLMYSGGFGKAIHREKIPLYQPNHYLLQRQTPPQQQEQQHSDVVTAHWLYTENPEQQHHQEQQQQHVETSNVTVHLPVKLPKNVDKPHPAPRHVPKVYGRLEIQLIQFAEVYIDSLFACDPAPSSSTIYPSMSSFLQSVMQRTRATLTCLVTSLLYLQRLKDLHPICRGSHGSAHRLALTALVVASKYLHDDSYDNRAWAQVSQGLFKTVEVNQMESEFLHFLGYKLFVNNAEWENFTAEIQFGLASYLRFTSKTLESATSKIKNQPPNNSNNHNSNNNTHRSSPYSGMGRSFSQVLSMYDREQYQIYEERKKKQAELDAQKSAEQQTPQHAGIPVAAEGG